MLQDEEGLSKWAHPQESPRLVQRRIQKGSDLEEIHTCRLRMDIFKEKLNSWSAYTEFWMILSGFTCCSTRSNAFKTLEPDGKNISESLARALWATDTKIKVVRVLPMMGNLDSMRHNWEWQCFFKVKRKPIWLKEHEKLCIGLILGENEHELTLLQPYFWRKVLRNWAIHFTSTHTPACVGICVQLFFATAPCRCGQFLYNLTDNIGWSRPVLIYLSREISTPGHHSHHACGVLCPLI